MASFELFQGRKTEEEVAMKYSLKKLEMAIQKFVKVVEIDLERLDKHKDNIEKFQKNGDYKSLSREQTNASRTVQAISANIKEIEQIRNQVMESDLKEFDSKVMAVKVRAVTNLMEFQQLHLKEDLGGDPSETNEQMTEDQTDVFAEDIVADPAEVVVQQKQLQLRRAATEYADTEKSWNELEHNLIELNSLVTEFSEIVHSQQETIDTIEDHVETAQENVEEGTTYLAKAAKYKSALMPVAGALIGGAVAGPIGIVAGLKVGGLAAVSGGIVGYSSANFLKNKQQAQIDNEMVDIRERREKKEQPKTAASNE